MSLRRRKRRLPSDVTGLIVLDSGAISRVAAEGDTAARQVWRQLTERGWASCVPAVTLAEVITGRQRWDAPTLRLLSQVDDVTTCDEPLGKAAGSRRGVVAPKRRLPSGIDAIVAAVAAANQPSVVLTTDPDDMSVLLADAPRAMVIGV